MMRKRSSNHLADRQRQMQQRSSALSRKIANIRKQSEDNFQMVDEDTLEETIDDDLEDAGYGDADEIYEDEFEEDFFGDDSEDDSEDFDAWEVDQPESDSTMQGLTSAAIAVKKLSARLDSLHQQIETLKNRKVASLKRKAALNNDYNKNKFNSDKSASGRHIRNNESQPRRRVR